MCILLALDVRWVNKHVNKNRGSSFTAFAHDLGGFCTIALWFDIQPFGNFPIQWFYRLLFILYWFTSKIDGTFGKFNRYFVTYNTLVGWSPPVDKYIDIMQLYWNKHYLHGSSSVKRKLGFETNKKFDYPKHLHRSSKPFCWK